MDNDRDSDKDINMLLWGKKGYKRLEDLSSNDFSLEKVLTYLKDKKESFHGDDL